MGSDASTESLSMPSGSGSFEGWEQVVFHFGRVAEGGSVRVSSASVLEAVSGESLSVVSESVSVSAGRSVEVSGGESVSVASDVVSVTASTSRVRPRRRTRQMRGKAAARARAAMRARASTFKELLA